MLFVLVICFFVIWDCQSRSQSHLTLADNLFGCGHDHLPVILVVAVNCYLFPDQKS